MTLSKHVHRRVHRPSRKLRGEICRYETFWMGMFERTTFLLLRCRSIHVKLCVLVTYSADIIINESNIDNMNYLVTEY